LLKTRATNELSIASSGRFRIRDIRFLIDDSSE
jgi:hypothetical protein